MVNSHKIGLHVHTQYSPDSNLSLGKLIKCALKRGLNAPAITDHNTIAGALRLRDMDPPFRVIVGEEIKTNEGKPLKLAKTFPISKLVRATISGLMEI